MAEKGSALISVEDDGRDNILSELVTLLEENGIPITRLIRLADAKESAKIYMRVNTPRPIEVGKLLRQRNFIVLQP
jgi:acetoin utilization protein AcuB